MKDYMGRKPVDIARQIGFKDVAQLLERASVRHAAMRRQGKRVWQWSCLDIRLVAS